MKFSVKCRFSLNSVSDLDRFYCISEIVLLVQWNFPLNVGFRLIQFRFRQILLYFWNCTGRPMKFSVKCRLSFNPVSDLDRFYHTSETYWLSNGNKYGKATQRENHRRCHTRIYQYPECLIHCISRIPTSGSFKKKKKNIQQPITTGVNSIQFTNPQLQSTFYYLLMHKTLGYLNNRTACSNTVQKIVCLSVSVSSMSRWSDPHQGSPTACFNNDLRNVHNKQDPYRTAASGQSDMRVYPKVSGLAAWSENCH
jgi:hypothetical protein